MLPSSFQPSTVEEAAAILADLGAKGQPVRPIGTGTRLGWGGSDPESTVDVRSIGLNRIREHNPGDFTAVIEAGVTLDEAQATFASAGQWLAVDPPRPSGTIGGLVATADSGPARHRYGGMRDLIIGITVVLSDGTVASAGGKVIKNVAGYDLGKLFTGSYGTLGFIASVAVRLHPGPSRTVTLSARTDDPARLGRVAVDLAQAPLEALCLDAWWNGGSAGTNDRAGTNDPAGMDDRAGMNDSGGILVRFAGVAASEQADRTRPLLDGLADVSVVDDDEPLWAEQRARQRSTAGAVVKVSGRVTDLPDVVAAARAAGATVTSRAALGLSWLTLPAGTDVAQRVAALRQALAPRACTVLDGSSLVGEPWPVEQPGVVAVMRRVKARFDPARIFRPGSYLGGI
jgi:glycolate oxidase FAD binding subunit